MPGVVNGAVSVATFPASLSTKFTQSRSVLTRVNEYKDGSQQRSSLVTEVRRSWKLSKRLTVDNLATLRTFWQNNPNTAFTFNDPVDGNSYLVCFASDWEETVGMVRSNVSVELLELSSNPDGAPATIPDTLDFVLHGAVTSSRLFVLTSHTPGGGPGAIVANNILGIFERGWLGGDTTWTLRTDSTPVDAASLSRLKVFFSFTTAFPGSVSPPEQFLVYDCYVQVAFADGTVSTFRPTSSTVIDTSQGTIADPANVIDGDPSTAATLTKTSVTTVDFSPVMSVQNFV